MAVIRNPLNRKRFVRVNPNYDNQELIVENARAQTKQFKWADKSDQFTQNSWNMSPYTRAHAYRDVTVTSPTSGIISEFERRRGRIRPQFGSTR